MGRKQNPPDRKMTTSLSLVLLKSPFFFKKSYEENILKEPSCFSVVCSEAILGTDSLFLGQQWRV